jgi:glycosyltransferase involved in cell wall biosynthesis
MPLVSVVIPTLDRPTLLMRALISVFQQTHQELEVLVVLHGSQPETDVMLRTISDDRLRVLTHPVRLNASAARNFGADAAQGEWIAFLDDDDEWLPNKIERQLAFAAGRTDVLVTCLSRVETPTSSTVMPQVIYDNVRPFDEYLFDRRSPFEPLSFMQTSGLFVPRAAFQKARFRLDAAHEDWDFVLCLNKLHGMRIETVPEVLAILYFEEPRPSAQSSWTSTASLNWIEMVRPMISRRSYAGLCLGVVGARAAKERAWSAFLPLLYHSFLHGSPRVWRLCTYLSAWFLPGGGYRALRDGLRRHLSFGSLVRRESDYPAPPGNRTSLSH